MKKKVLIAKKKIQKVVNGLKNDVVIFQAKNGALELRGDFTHETVWATQAEIVSIFGVDQSVVSRHIKNIFNDGEIEEKSNMQKMHNAISDKPALLYSLDVILGVGYRTNSKVAIEFRKWATKTLRNYIVEGFVVDKKRITKNYTQFLVIVEDIKKLLPLESSVDPKDAVELISLFADTWLSLDAYDRELLPKSKLTKKTVTLSVEKVAKNLTELRNVLIEKGEATEVFGHERSRGSISGIIGNVMQSFGGADVYPTVEEKAAHILYFMVKNHPFTDGNKRSGAFAFVWFLQETKLLNSKKITPQTLTALTVLVAESDPNDKDKIIKLILNLVSK